MMAFGSVALHMGMRSQRNFGDWQRAKFILGALIRYGGCLAGLPVGAGSGILCG